jgi:hypothetical protein
MDRLAYSVTTFPLTNKLDSMDAESVLDAIQKSIAAEIDPDENPKVEPQAKPERVPAGLLAGRELTITTQPPRSKDRTATRVRVYLIGDRIYILSVSGTDEVMKSPNASRFWNSFRTPADKSRNPPNK